MSKIKVGFDISQLAHGGGVATYTDQISQQLIKINDLELVFFYSLLRKPYRGNLQSVKRFFIPPTLLEFLFNQIRLFPIEQFIGKIDIFHSNDWMQPPTSAKKITTYHDLIPIKFPQWSHPKVVAVHRRRLAIVEKEIDCVIAVSEATKRDLLEVSTIPEEKIAVIYEGVGQEFRPFSDQEVLKFREKYHLPDKFILAIGGIGERRNLRRVKLAAKNYHLVVTGQDLPYLANEEMPLLYSAAKILLYPSLYEGFGLPILEAMASGTPVVTSNVSSMPEVGGEAALYVEPEDEHDITNKLKAVMEDEKLRGQLIKKGLLQAKKFSWKKCAAETAQLYRQLNE